MAEYGLTSNGPNPKRLDTILDEMHAKLTERLGVNTKQNPQSLLCHLLTNIADELAELWEYGVDVYQSQYPSSAEGVSLDNALQFGGITREMPLKSYYNILCTGIDGTEIPSGAMIASSTNPSTALVLDTAATISRAAFNKAVVIPATENGGGTYSIVLDGELHSAETLAALAEDIDGDSFEASLEDGKLLIASVDDTSNHVMVLSENMTTETVSTIVVFATEEYGDIAIPEGAITNITRAVAGLKSVVNVGDYIAGRLAETDTEFRQSHLDKIYNLSSSMVESIRSAILENVQGVRSCAVYENDTNETDELGRPPHSIEAVVDGGDRNEIAAQIFRAKAGGISTYCTNDANGESVVIHGDYGEDITVRFNRPVPVYVWFQVRVTFSRHTNPPTNYADLIKETLLDCMEEVGTGTDVVPQKFTDELYKTVPGIDYFDILLFSTQDPAESPRDYQERSVSITARQRAVTSESRIGVVIDA